jgi:hypothetical protein
MYILVNNACKSSFDVAKSSHTLYNLQALGDEAPLIRLATDPGIDHSK